MKRFTRFSWPFIFSFVMLLLAFSSCKKSNKDVPDPNNPNQWNDGSMSATIAGNSWRSTSLYAVDSAQTIFIFAGSGTTNYPLIMMTFPDNTAQGATINFDLSQLTILQYIENSSSSYWAEPAMGGSGSITISKFSKSTKRVEGTFTASLKSTNAATTKSLTGGQFAINYR